MKNRREVDTSMWHVWAMGKLKNTHRHDKNPRRPAEQNQDQGGKEDAIDYGAIKNQCGGRKRYFFANKKTIRIFAPSFHPKQKQQTIYETESTLSCRHNDDDCSLYPACNSTEPANQRRSQLERHRFWHRQRQQIMRQRKGFSYCRDTSRLVSIMLRRSAIDDLSGDGAFGSNDLQQEYTLRWQLQCYRRAITDNRLQQTSI